MSDVVLCAWVEGELSFAEEARLASVYPAEATLVRSIRRDCSLLRSLGDEAAPRGLGARAMEQATAAMEREALAGLSLNGQSEESELPVSQIVPERESAWFAGEGGVIARIGPRAAPLALAAGLAMLVGGSAFMVYVAKRSTGGANSPIVAMENRVGESGSLSQGPMPTDTDDSMTLAAAKSSDAGINDVTDGTEMASLAAPANVSAEVVIAAESMSLERAVALAGEGRLLIRVRRSDDGSLAQVDAALRDSRELGRDFGRAWKLSASVPETVLASLRSVSDHPGASPGRDESPLVLTNTVGEPKAEFDPPFTMPGGWEMLTSGMVFGPRHERTDRTLIADVRLTEESVAALVKALAGKSGAAVELEELVAPIEIELAPDPDAILWWTQPPANWAGRAGVAVVVDRK